MPIFTLPGQAPYVLTAPESLATPRLLVFRDRVERNLQRMQAYLEEVAPASGYRHLCPHVKTNKSSLLTGWLQQAGVGYFKTTMREVEMTINAGAQDIFVAYPLLEHDARELAHLVRKFRQIKFHVQVGSLAHAEILQRIGRNEQVTWHFFIDLDVGMHRTGIAPEDAFSLYAHLAKQNEFIFAGLHGYDGHIHHATAAERRAESQRAMEKLSAVFQHFRRERVHIPRVIVAGTPAFRFDFEILHKALGDETLVQVSPGTWIFWDSNYERLAPGEFEIAAVILAQVMDIGQPHRLTLNLGHKRWSVDSGPVRFFSRPGLKFVSVSEEHTVLAHEGTETFQIGDYVLLAPHHVCPTINLYEEFSVIGEHGEIEIAASPVDGRNR
ncbi:alanine racemase [candidate division KSB1 bacterium]|nr:alanine racemase [candidate division KSB1 bacterium]